jgi:hypothetical protein
MYWAETEKVFAVHKGDEGFMVSVLSCPLSENVTNLARARRLLGHNGAWIGLRPAQVAQNTLKTIESPLDTL